MLLICLLQMDLGDITNKQYKTLGDAVGMPDEVDKENIRKIILKFEREHPGEILAIIEYAKASSSAFTNEFGLVSGKSNSKGISSNSLRYQMELPPDLHRKIEEYIPTIFSDKKHYAWFKKNFRELFLPEKI